MKPFRRKASEPTITLINVVFLLLAFFIVAGTIADRPPADVRLISLPEGPSTPLENIVLLRADGRVEWPVGHSAASYLAQRSGQGAVRILADRDAPAAALVATAQTLAEQGAKEIRLIAERLSQ